MLLVASMVSVAQCTQNLHRISDLPHALAVTTPEHTRSMIYLLRTDGGVVVVDLGWRGAERALRNGLRRLNADTADVAAVLLTHSHRDHIGAWRAVRSAMFVLHRDELPLFHGDAAHRDRPSRVAARILGRGAVPPGAVKVQPFSADTVLVFGRDTVRAFHVGGHTAGSAAYLVRHVLFVGDALSYRVGGGIAPASRAYTADAAAARSGVASLAERVSRYRVDWVCTAHARCASYGVARRVMEGRVQR